MAYLGVGGRSWDRLAPARPDSRNPRGTAETMDLVAAPPLLESLDRVIESSGLDLGAWGLAWARTLPAVAIVPAFGLRAVPVPVRVAMAVVLAASVAPAMRPIAESGGSWPLLLLLEVGRGLPVALTAAVALWAATMAGGLIDNLRNVKDSLALPNVEQGATPTGALLAMLVAVAFLQTGGPARVAEALSDPGLSIVVPLTRAVHNLKSGIELAVAVAAPVLVASVVVEVGAALIARAMSPAFVQPLLAPLRSIAILGVAAVFFDRMLELLVVSASSFP